MISLGIQFSEEGNLKLKMENLKLIVDRGGCCEQIFLLKSRLNSLTDSKPKFPSGSNERGV